MKKIMGIILILFFALSFAVPSLASSSNTFSTQAVNGLPQSNLQTQTPASNVNPTDYQGAVNQAVKVPKVTIDQASSWAQKKGFDVVHLLQKFVQPFAIIIFILSAIMAMFGAFGNSQLTGKGIWGMAIAVIMYAVVLYAPQLMDSVTGWLASN